MTVVTANDLKTKGISAIERVLRGAQEFAGTVLAEIGRWVANSTPTARYSAPSHPASRADSHQNAWPFSTQLKPCECAHSLSLRGRFRH